MSSPFNGTWKIALAKSRVWDAEKNSWISPDPIGIEEVTIFVTDELYDQVITAGVNPTMHLTYTAFWGGEWVPFMLRSLEYPAENLPEPPKTDVGLKVTLEAGKPIAYVKMILINDRFHYRITRGVDGHSPGYVMSRRMHEGDNSYTATVLSPGGAVVFERHFDRA